MKAHEERISKLVRERRGAAMRPVFLASVSMALGHEVSVIDLVSLEVTDELRKLAGLHYAAVKDSVEPGFASFFSAPDKGVALSLMDLLGSKVEGESAVMLFRQSEYCGGITADASDCLLRTDHLLAVDRDGLTLISSDCQNGVLFDFSPDDPEFCCEVVVWGETWPLRLLGDLQA